MHRITKMDIEEQCNDYVLPSTIKTIQELVDYYNNFDDLKKSGEIAYKDKEELFQVIVANCPMGLMLTARITTNYLQLKSMYNQRKSHKLEEWRVFCEWIESLPKSYLITGKEMG